MANKEKKVIELEVVTNDGKIAFSDEVYLCRLPGEEGVFTLLPNHTPFLSTLKYGELRYKKDVDDKKYEFATVIGGFCEFKNNKLNIVTKSFELGKNIDKSRAEESKKRANKRIEDKDNQDIDFTRAELSLKRALIRLEVANEYKKAKDIF